MQNGRERNDELLSKLQNTLFPERTGQSIDYKALAMELRTMANFCEAKGNLNSLDGPISNENGVTQSRKKMRRIFNFTDYRTKFIALQVFYLGWDYSGFASQDTGPTIEKALIEAMKTTRLIPDDYPDSRAIKYSKCGRTDKGVSALGQVISLVVRSRRKLSEPEATMEEEYDYPTMLNSVLPPEIRVWGWTVVPLEFSARYSPLSRIYKYFIIDEMATPMDMNLIQECTQKFLGYQNFRNFCKMNLSQTTNHEREIKSIDLIPVDNFSFPKRKVYCLTIKGNAFLWHQVRCMVATLFMIGQGLESPDIIDKLLDIEGTPSKPLYTPANEVPLVLWGCEYDPELKFRRSHWQLERNRDQLREDINRRITQLVITQHIYDELLATPHDGQKRTIRELKYIPLLERQREPGFAERMERHIEKFGEQ
eukprot:g910.t1